MNIICNLSLQCDFCHIVKIFFFFWGKFGLYSLLFIVNLLDLLSIINKTINGG